MDYLLRVKTVPLSAVLLLTLVLPYSTLSENSVAGPSLSLVESGQPAATIVIPEDAPKWTRQGAAWLQEYVEKASGAKLAIVTEDESPEGTLISVGHTELAKRAGIDLQDLKWDGCRLAARGGKMTPEKNGRWIALLI